MSGSATTILVIEDNCLDFENLERGLKRLQIDNPVIWAKDGLEGLDVLRGHGATPGLKRPYVVLLDLNMPRMSGVEFLDEVRRDEAIADTPIFVLTTSDHHQDLQAAHRRNVCGYIVKPMEREKMTEALSMLNAYIHVCRLPTETRRPF